MVFTFTTQVELYHGYRNDHCGDGEGDHRQGNRHGRHGAQLGVRNRGRVCVLHREHYMNDRWCSLQGCWHLRVKYVLQLLIHPYGACGHREDNQHGLGGRCLGVRNLRHGCGMNDFRCNWP
jgi:hypothetical protein